MPYCRTDAAQPPLLTCVTCNDANRETMIHLPAIGTAHAIRIAGADARRFAQAQFAGDVNALVPGHWQWNAWLTPAGRVRALLWLIDTGDDGLLALLRGGDAARAVVDLRRYVLRAQVTLDAVRFAMRAGGAQPNGTVIGDSAGLTLGCSERSLHLASPVTESVDAAARDAWTLADIRAGWPILPEGEPEFLPPALGLKRLGAIAFDKGCYPGQEIAARLHFRGGHKWQLCHLRGPGLLSLGAARDAAGEELFIIAAVCEDGVGEALAVVNVTINNEINVMDNCYRVVSSFVV